MQIFKEKEALQTRISTFRKEGFSIGLVPTMGALHKGHLSLIESALENSGKVVISIFVNPTQFDNPKDLELYPRDLEKDIQHISRVSEDVIVFSPDPQEIYGSRPVSEEFSFDGLEDEMEGKYRKGHFNGVGTIIRKLFEIIRPDKAFFGEKDFQQLQIIRKLVDKLQLNVQIIGWGGGGGGGGLARSSRNERLDPENRKAASMIYEILQQVRADFGTKSVSDINAWVRSRFSDNNRLRLEYFEIADSQTLKSVANIDQNRKYRAFIAAFAGDVRLIDNIALN